MSRKNENLLSLLSQTTLATDVFNGLIEYSGETMEELTWFRLRDSLAGWLLSWIQDEALKHLIYEIGIRMFGKEFIGDEYCEDEPLYIASTRH